MPQTSAWLRRARPLLGTLVELGLAADTPAPDAALAAGFAAVAAVQAALSRFDPHSDIGRFAVLPAGASLALQPVSQRVLRAAQALRQASGGRFDPSLGPGLALGSTGRWHCQGGRLHKLTDGVQLDLGGIAKGHALDAAVQALRRAGARSGWVNAGGDLCAFGLARLPLQLRDELHGGVRPLGWLQDGAFATSRFGPGCASPLHGAGGDWPGGPAAPGAVARHVSVAAPRGLWADALTKLVAATGDASHPLLARLGAQAWLH
jgi:thiamine biosynthesis lipoprotein